MTWFEVFAVSPVSLITCSMVPTPPRDTVTRSWNWTAGILGTSRACQPGDQEASFGRWPQAFRFASFAALASSFVVAATRLKAKV